MKELQFQKRWRVGVGAIIEHPVPKGNKRQADAAGGSDVQGCSVSQSVRVSDTDQEGKHSWQRDRSHAPRWNYLSSFSRRVCMGLLRF